MSAAALALSLRGNVKTRETPSQRKQRMTVAQLRAELKGARQRPEAKLHKAVIEYLRLVLPKTAAIHHSPNEGKRGWMERAALKNNGTMAGWPDIEIVWDGRIFFLELKSNKGKPSAAQIACHFALAQAGAGVATCRTIDAVANVLAIWKIPTRAASSLPVQREAA
jgi:hypothetical protein